MRPFKRTQLILRCSEPMQIMLFVLYYYCVLCYHTEKNRDMLERSGFYKMFGEEWLFPTIKDAVEFAKSGTNLLQVSYG